MRRRRKPKTRYVVGSVTGYAINQATTNGERKPRTIWYVYDSANCYLPMAVPGLTFGERGEKKCRALARQLNAEQKAWLETLA